MKKLTRFEEQVEILKNKLKKTETFGNEKLNIFNLHLPAVKKVLKTYKITVTNTDNCFVDKQIIGDGVLFRVYIKTSGQHHLSDRQISNLENKLRKFIPMPYHPISLSSISVVYSEQ